MEIRKIDVLGVGNMGSGIAPRLGESGEDPEEASSLEEVLLDLRNRWVAGGGSLEVLECQVGRKLPAWLK